MFSGVYYQKIQSKWTKVAYFGQFLLKNAAFRQYLAKMLAKKIKSKYSTKLYCLQK